MTSPSGSFRSAAAEYEALVIGGGPAGAAAATILARRGRRVLVVERERFPRFHIGESLIPETNRYLEALGVYGQIAAAGFPVKRGAILVAPDGEHERYACFADAEGVARTTTFEVSRDRFDRILLDHAADSGAEVLQACRAREVELDAEGVTVRIEDGAGPRAVRCRYLVDASGRDGFLARRLGLRIVDPALRMVGVHAWYEGVVPPPPDRAGDLRLVSIDGEGWAWLIPLGGGVTSVGVVVTKERWAGLAAADPVRRLEVLVETAPALARYLTTACRVSDVRVDGDYSYATRAYTGERWLLAGDAGSFLDPVFSTGVLLALSSGTQAGEAVNAALAAGGEPRLARKPFDRYDREQRRVYRFFRRFVLGYYRPAFRDVLLSPAERLGLASAGITALAGNSRPSFLVRLRLEAFFLFARLQRHLPIAPRLHGPPVTGGRIAGEDRRATAP